MILGHLELYSPCYRQGGVSSHPPIDLKSQSLRWVMRLKSVSQDWLLPGIQRGIHSFLFPSSRSLSRTWAACPIAFSPISGLNAISFLFDLVSFLQGPLWAVYLGSSQITFLISDSLAQLHLARLFSFCRFQRLRCHSFWGPVFQPAPGVAFSTCGRRGSLCERTSFTKSGLFPGVPYWWKWPRLELFLEGLMF